VADSFSNPLCYADDIWIDPLSGTPIAKDLDGNTQQRAAWSKIGEDPKIGAQICALCAESFPLWANLFGWIIELVRATSEGNIAREQAVNIPFITWPCQDAAIAKIQRSKSKGRSVAVEKARDMGASWLCLMFIAWDCLFHPGANWLIISRKEEEVWFPGDQKALFSKLLHIFNSLPPWMRPTYTLRERHIALDFSATNGGEMTALNSVMTGESTNSYAGIGDRRTGLFIDEAAAIDILRSIVSNTSDTGPFRIYNSTNRAGSYFTTHLLPSGRVDIVQLPWYDHPIKGDGRRRVTDERGKMRIVSDWYLAETAKRDVAENMDMDRLGAGQAIFDATTIARQKAQYVALAAPRGDVVLPEGLWVDPDQSPATWPTKRAAWRDSESGLLTWFGDLVEDEHGRLRPRQDHNYGIGFDTGTGVGQNPSVASIVDADAGIKVGKWSDQWTSPDEYADVLFLLAHWIGGRNGLPLFVGEANGPGANTLMRLKRLHYPRIYCHTEELRGTPHETDKLGWHSTRPGKLQMLEEYRADLAADRFRNPDGDALDQCLTYIHYETGGCGPSILADMTEEQRAQHGDEVIADMLGNLARKKVPKLKPEEAKPPPGSFGDRQLRREARDRAIKRRIGRRVM
jgi:hypothetical protein